MRTFASASSCRRKATFAVLGEQVLKPAWNVLKAANSGTGIAEILEEPDSCDATGGEDAASAFVEAGVDAVIGFLCMESLTSALPDAIGFGDSLAITLGVRSGNHLRGCQSGNGWLFLPLVAKRD